MMKMNDDGIVNEWGGGEGGHDKGESSGVDIKHLEYYFDRQYLKEEMRVFTEGDIALKQSSFFLLSGCESLVFHSRQCTSTKINTRLRYKL